MWYSFYMNAFNNISAESELAPLITADVRELDANDYGAEGGDVDRHDDTDDLPYEGAGFPGCGDGSDDFADMNANEADDYANE